MLGNVGTAHLFLLVVGGEGEEASFLPGGGEEEPDSSSECFLGGLSDSIRCHFYAHLLMGYEPGIQPPGV